MDKELEEMKKRYSGKYEFSDSYFRIKAEVAEEGKGWFSGAFDRFIARGLILDDMIKEKKELEDKQVRQTQEEFQEYYESRKDKSLAELKMERFSRGPILAVAIGFATLALSLLIVEALT